MRGAEEAWIRRMLAESKARLTGRGEEEEEVVFLKRKKRKKKKVELVIVEDESSVDQKEVLEENVAKKTKSKVKVSETNEEMVEKTIEEAVEETLEEGVVESEVLMEEVQVEEVVCVVEEIQFVKEVGVEKEVPNAAKDKKYDVSVSEQKTTKKRKLGDKTEKQKVKKKKKNIRVEVKEEPGKYFINPLYDQGQAKDKLKEGDCIHLDSEEIEEGFSTLEETNKQMEELNNCKGKAGGVIIQCVGARKP